MIGLIILSFVALPSVSATGPKHVKVSQATINKYVKQVKGLHAGPNFQWANNARVTFTCGSQGCAFSFNENATKGLLALMAVGTGIAGVVTAVLTISGVGAPVAAMTGLVVAMFVVTGAWMGLADWFGGGQGIYGAWYLGTTIFYIWCNPLPAQFMPAVTTTSTTSTDPVTTTVTQTITQTASSTSTQSSSTTTTTSTTTVSTTCVFANGRERCYAPTQ